MESITRVGGTDELGSGRKVVRRRQRPAASPYIRPRLRPPPPSPSPTPNSIFSRFATGAGKILSSVFIGGSSSSYSRFSSSDDEIDDEDDIDCDTIAHSNEVKGLSEREAVIPVTNNDRAVVNQLISQKNEAKLAKIKKLLTQETFSREECSRLVKIIQSRVVDHTTSQVNELAKVQNGAHARAVGGNIAYVQTQWSLPETRKSFIPFPFSNNRMIASSPGGFGLYAHGLHLHEAAIMKARRWIKEKKESTSKSTMDGGLCTLNTDMLTHFTKGAVLSPVDMAKSYMQARPPWASPSLSDIGFRTAKPLGMQLYKDETPYAVNSYSLPSLKC